MQHQTGYFPPGSSLYRQNSLAQSHPFHTATSADNIKTRTVSSSSNQQLGSSIKHRVMCDEEEEPEIKVEKTKDRKSKEPSSVKIKIEKTEETSSRSARSSESKVPAS